MSFYKTTWTGIIGLKQLNYVMDYCRILQAFSVTIDSSFKSVEDDFIYDLVTKILLFVFTIFLY